jgi:pyridinium-3,5-bisthiocarboxylic acid mononucleotide nickel chelatase
MARKVAYLDCHSGISGSMLLAALLDAGFSLDTLRQALATSSLHGYQLQYDTVLEKGIRGSRFSIVLEETAMPSGCTTVHENGRDGLFSEGTAMPSGCTTVHGNGRDEVSSEEQNQPDHSLSDAIAVLHTCAISQHVRERAISIVQRLAEAEAAVQGIDVGAVRFGAAEMIQMVIASVGVALGTEELGIAQYYASVLPLTNGHVQTHHGLLPVPTPVTLELLRRVGAPLKLCALEAELVTPTAAAILATLAHFGSPVMAIERVGYGFGHHHLPWPNCLRLCLGKTFSEIGGPDQDVDTDWVTVIETHIDNMSGEILGGVMEHLLTAGALDVTYTPIQMKKNRPATLVTVICPCEDGERLTLVLLRETSTLGVRIQQVQRRKAQRTQEWITTPFGPMLVKVKRLGSRIISATPEYEECQRVAREQDMPLTDIYEIVRQAVKQWP